MRGEISGQMTFFDEAPMLARAAEYGKRANCYKCVGFESHRCRDRLNANIDEKTFGCPDGMGYAEYAGSMVRRCIGATIEIFQDGYIRCPRLRGSYSCGECMEKLGDSWLFDETQNYEKKPRRQNLG
jgi:hypothetical protein